MGYQTTFRLKKELDSKFKPYIGKPIDASEKLEGKMMITAECMKNIRTVTEDGKNNEMVEIDYRKLFKAISWQVRSYVLTVQQDWKYYVEQHLKKNNNEIWFCGWEYSEGRNSMSSWDSVDEVISFFTEQLFLHAMHPTSSPYADEHDDYYQKLQEISDEINEIEDAVNRTMDSEFIGFYRDNEELADESDGYNHFFPEEKDEMEKDNETEDDEEENDDVNAETNENVSEE